MGEQYLRKLGEGSSFLFTTSETNRGGKGLGSYKRRTLATKLQKIIDSSPPQNSKIYERPNYVKNNI